MTTRELHVAVSGATGETIASIARRGFTIEVRPPERPDFLDDPESYGVDWDAAEKAHGVEAFRLPRCPTVAA